MRLTVRFKTDVKEANRQIVANTITDSAPYIATDTSNNNKLKFEFKLVDSYIEVNKELGISIVDYNANNAQAYASLTLEQKTRGKLSTTVKVREEASLASYSYRQLDSYARTIERPAVFRHK